LWMKKVLHGCREGQGEEEGLTAGEDVKIEARLSEEKKRGGGHKVNLEKGEKV